MKKIKIIYWIFTGLFAALMLFASIPDIINSPSAIAFMHDHLGYPVYFIPFTGVAKTLGVIAILIPGFPILKEWAYAGLAYDLTGAVFSQIAVGDPVNKWAFTFIWIIFGIGSYIYYHKKLKAVSSAS